MLDFGRGLPHLRAGFHIYSYVNLRSSKGRRLDVMDLPIKEIGKNQLTLKKYVVL
jgi:hypothetical protein